MHPDYFNVGPNLYRNNDTGKFHYIEPSGEVNGKFSPPYDTLEEAAKALKGATHEH